ncbi:MAG: sigma-70 family RNA polymerase sigma factor [Myxococcota bacterium]
MNPATRASFEATLAPHLDELYGAAVRLTRSRADADDVLQEAMARAWAFWDRFEEGTNARAWMHRILYNTFVNGYRRKKREREILGQVRRETVRDAHWSRGERTLRGPIDPQQGIGDEVKAALEALPDTFRLAVELVDLRGQSYKDAADAIGCPVGTVMSRLHRGRRLLKESLVDYARSEGYIPAAA